MSITQFHDCRDDSDDSRDPIEGGGMSGRSWTAGKGRGGTCCCWHDMVNKIVACSDYGGCAVVALKLCCCFANSTSNTSSRLLLSRCLLSRSCEGISSKQLHKCTEGKLIGFVMKVRKKMCKHR